MGCGCKKYLEIPRGFFRLVTKVEKSEVNRRIKICLDCDKSRWFFGFLLCRKCGCFIPAKAQSGTCPDLHW